MNNSDNEKLIQRFFNENRVRIESDDFTRSVMHRLPDRAVRLNRLWTAFCAVLLVLVVIKLNVLTWVDGMVRGLAADVTAGGTLSGGPVLPLFAMIAGAVLVSAALLVKELR